MFDDDKEEYERFFDWYLQRFKENVAIMPAVFEDEDFEIDVVLGEETELIRGIRVLQFVELEDEEGEEGEEQSSKDSEAASSDEEGEDDEGEDDVAIGAICFDLAADPTAKIQGKPLFEIVFGEAPEEEEENEAQAEESEPVRRIIIYSEDGTNLTDITGALLLDETLEGGKLPLIEFEDL